MAYNFIGGNKGRTRVYRSTHNPMLNLSRHALYIPTTIYENLGRPLALLISFDPKKKAIQLTPTDIGGYKVQIARPRQAVNKDGSQVEDRYSVASMKTDAQYTIRFGTLPTGLYRPVDNGIFEYHAPLKTVKSPSEDKN